MTTLRKLDGIVTSNMNDTLNYMLNYFVPEDKDSEDNGYYRLINAENSHPMDTQDDKDFIPQETKIILERMDPKKAPGEDGISSKILLQIFKLVQGTFLLSTIQSKKQPLPTTMEERKAHTDS